MEWNLCSTFFFFQGQTAGVWLRRNTSIRELLSIRKTSSLSRNLWVFSQVPNLWPKNWPGYIDMSRLINFAGFWPITRKKRHCLKLAWEAFQCNFGKWMGPNAGAFCCVYGNPMVWPLHLIFNIIFILESSVKILDSRIKVILKIKY